jgi:serine/threonine protein phosphatase 1
VNASTGGRLVYAVGDVHGCYGLMRELLGRITADVARRGRRPILVFLGDYVDRGPDSARVLEALVWLKRRDDIELHLLKGNHEEALLAFLDAPEQAAPWLHYGGDATLAAYGVDFGEAQPADLVRARDELLASMPASHLRLLQGLELMVEVGGYAFVHAGVRPGVPLARQSEQDLLWIRQGFLDVPGPFEKTIVHGHTWLDHRPQFAETRLGIDTGAFMTGVLSAVRLEGTEVEVIQAGAPAIAEAAA